MKLNLLIKTDKVTLRKWEVNGKKRLFVKRQPISMHDVAAYKIAAGHRVSWMYDSYQNNGAFMGLDEMHVGGVIRKAKPMRPIASYGIRILYNHGIRRKLERT